MLARNPKTGTPIRILRSEASLWRNRKTLVWLQDQSTTVQWDRWDTLCVGITHTQKWKESGQRVDYFVLPESSPEAVSFFLGVQPSDYKMMFIPKQLVFGIGWQKFKALQITNVIVSLYRKGVGQNKRRCDNPRYFYSSYVLFGGYA